MRFFTGEFERGLDAKNRLQLPSDFRECIDSERDGAGLYVTLGEHRGTLSLFTERAFHELAARMETETMSAPEAMQFELQFYGLTSHVEMDKQGRLVLPERLVRKARLPENVVLVGQKLRIDIWARDSYEKTLGIDWEGDAWPTNWQAFRRMRPSKPDA